jgi:hypothetical protein
MLSIYQGNDKVFKFFRTNANGDIITTTPQNIWFSVKTKYEDFSILFQKSIGFGITQNEDGSWNIKIEPHDTAEMKPGKYVCDVKIQDEAGNLFTIVKPQEFLIREVVTRVGNQGGF